MSRMNAIYKYILLIATASFFVMWQFVAIAEQQISISPTMPMKEIKKPIIIQACPQPEELINQAGTWITKNGRWKCYTPSTASKVTSFLGAQWAGIKVGKIICLYQTNEAVGFPLAVEQVSSKSILEPSGVGWSASTSDRRYCKSVNVADCSFVEAPERDTSDIYKEIEYNPRLNKNAYNAYK